MQFMEEALAGKPENSMAEPEGITTARIDPRTGLLAYPGQKNALFEMFTTDTVPKNTAAADEDGASEDGLNKQDEGVSMSPMPTPAAETVPVADVSETSVKEGQVPSVAPAVNKENEPLF